MPPLNFPLVEVAALLFVGQMADELEGTPFKEHFHDALRRITTSLSEARWVLAHYQQQTEEEAVAEEEAAVEDQSQILRRSSAFPWLTTTG